MLNKGPIKEMIEEACQKSNILDAIVYGCIWESERIIKQAASNIILDESGRKWDSFFKIIIEQILKEYDVNPTKLINGRIPPNTTCSYSNKCGRFKITACNGEGCPVCDGKTTDHEFSCSISRLFVIQEKNLTKENLKISKEKVITAIKQEPELPGKMPKAMQKSIKKFALDDDQTALSETFRIVVRETKKSIIERIELIDD